MKKSMCCGDEMIYLGKNRRGFLTPCKEGFYNYCCYKCGSLEWSTSKEKAKYKWYKIDKEKLKEILRVKDE